MENNERLANYVKRRTAAGRLAVLSEDNPLLTPAQRRRLRKSANSRRRHSHLDLPEYVQRSQQPNLTVEYTRRAPCPKCHPLPDWRRIGGDR